MLKAQKFIIKFSLMKAVKVLQMYSLKRQCRIYFGKQNYIKNIVETSQPADEFPLRCNYVPLITKNLLISHHVSRVSVLQRSQLRPDSTKELISWKVWKLPILPYPTSLTLPYLPYSTLPYPTVSSTSRSLGFRMVSLQVF